jgi:hypothetical protein
MVCNANSIQALFTDDDTFDECYKFILHFTSTQLPHYATRISTKLLLYFILFYCVMTIRISDFTCSKGVSRPTDTFFSFGIRWPGYEAEHSPTFNSKFKNAQS